MNKTKTSYSIKEIEDALTGRTAYFKDIEGVRPYYKIKDGQLTCEIYKVDQENRQQVITGDKAAERFNRDMERETPIFLTVI